MHRTTEPETIGAAVSSGCIRLVNQDIIDLHHRVPVGTHVVAPQNQGQAAVGGIALPVIASASEAIQEP